MFSALLAGGLLTAGATVAGSIINSSSQRRTNAQNLATQAEINAQNIKAQKDINQSQLDYAKSMTQAQWERDDNAHQREVADLAAAGLSPLANTTGSPVTQAQSFHPLNEGVAEAYQAQAPQIDTNAIVNSLVASQEIGEKMRQHDDKMIREDEGLELESEKLQQNLMIIEQNAKIHNDNYSLELSKHAHACIIDAENLSIAKETVKNAKDHNEREEAIKTFVAESEQIQNALSDSTKQGHYVSKPFIIRGYADLVNYETELKNWTAKFNTFLESKAISKKSSKGFSVGLGGTSHSNATNGMGHGESGEWDTGFKGSGSGAGANIGAGYSSTNNSFREVLLLKKFYAENPYPVAVYRN